MDKTQVSICNVARNTGTKHDTQLLEQQPMLANALLALNSISMKAVHAEDRETQW